MVSWAGDGLLAGYDPITKRLKTGLYHFASGGSVDLNGITRIGFGMGAGLSAATYPNRLQGSLPFTFTSGDFAANPGKVLSAALFLVDADWFPEGHVPTPSEILALGDAKVSVARASWYATAPQTKTFQVNGWVGPALGVNTKWWVLALPTALSDPNSAWSVANDRPLNGITVNSFGRALSVWSDRTPEKPTITSPLPNSIALPGTEFTITVDPNDPDEAVPPDDAQRFNRDVNGIQIQYAPMPTVDNPDPEWKNLLYDMQSGSEKFRFYAWHIRGSRYVNGLPALPELEALVANLGCPVVAGAGLSEEDYQPGKGALPTGEWQLRVRTFGYGHPYPNLGTSTTQPGPLGINPATTQLIEPAVDSYPEIMTSPWSDTVRISIPSQVPPPLPLSPADNIAISEGSTVRLRWKYRNTHQPPFPQYLRSVQIRPVSGNHPWSTVFAGVSSDEYVDLPAVHTVTPVAPAELLANGGFESAGVDTWASTSTLTNVVDAPYAHSGSRYLRVVNPDPSLGTTFGITRSFEDVPPEYGEVDFSGWVRCDFDSGPTKVFVTMYWVNDITGPIIPENPFDSPYVILGEKALVSGWDSFHIPRRLQRPVGGDHIIVSIETGLTNDLYTSPSEMYVDDLSVMGYGYDIQPFTMVATTNYEWRVQTVDTDGKWSDFSEGARFWVVPAGASGEVRPIPTETVDGATLGCGTHRAFIYRRGGVERVGEIKNISHLDWSRVRDDISTAEVVVSGWDVDCGNLLAKLQTWAYELVIFRDNGYSVDRVWEGPITLLTYEQDKVTIDAKDVMAYSYRRIIKQRMSDAGKGNGTTVVDRARRVLQNVFAPDDPNLLAYMQVLARSDDAMQYRTTPAYSRTAFEEIDDMAANSGLDYTALGRAILLWGTKHRIGTLPEFRDKDLGSPPIVSEYGMSMANVYAVSDGNGVWGEATRLTDGGDPIYGIVEMLSSTWASDSENESGTYTQEGLETIRQSFKEYAERSIADRYPPPVVVRVPDNTTLNPSAVVSIQHLVPGVVIPLRSSGTLRTVVASQKLDSVKVVEEGGTETISITLSPFSRDDAAIIEGGEEG